MAIILVPLREVVDRTFNARDHHRGGRLFRQFQRPAVSASQLQDNPGHELVEAPLWGLARVGNKRVHVATMSRRAARSKLRLLKSHGFILQHTRHKKDGFERGTFTNYRLFFSMVGEVGLEPTKASGSGF